MNVASREEKKATRVLGARSIVVDEGKRVAANDDKLIRPRVNISQLSDEDIRAGFPEVSPEIREAGARLREKVRLAKTERGYIRGEQPAVGESGVSQEEVSPLVRQVESVPQMASQTQSSESRQTLPLSSQALRFEIQTREEQLKTLQDQGERIRIQSQLQAYRKLLEESERPVLSQEQSSESHQTLPLSSQALRFEIQTREEQLKTLQDQGERIRIQSQLQAYRKLLEESEPRTVRDERLVSSQVVSKTTSSRLWGRVKEWFGNVFGK